MKKILSFIESKKAIILALLGLVSIIFGKIKLNAAISKASKVREEAKTNLGIVEDIHEQNLEEYSEEDYASDIFIVRTKEVVGYIKAFAIPFVIFSFGVLLLVHSVAYYNLLNI